MKKFLFELEDVLSFRKIEQQQAEAELAKALAAEREVQNMIDSLAMQQVKTAKSMEGSTDFLAIAQANEFYGFIRAKTEELLSEITKLKVISDEKREKLRLCMQRTESLEKLKEKQKEDFISFQKKAEAKEIDNIVTSRFQK
ncbi:MAG: flagellar export protein FliJ [Treponema sp.]|nr:flagellar export protein FliJ [Treponema sp.]